MIQEINNYFHSYLESERTVPSYILPNVEETLRRAIGEVLQRRQRDSHGSTAPTASSQHYEMVSNSMDNTSDDMFLDRGWGPHYTIPGSFPLPSTATTPNDSRIFIPQLPPTLPVTEYSATNFPDSNSGSSTGQQLFPTTNDYRGTQPPSQNGFQDPYIAQSDLSRFWGTPDRFFPSN
jgi:hypothetical protein